MNQTLKFTIAVLVLLFQTVVIQSQSGGNFTVRQSVIAGGGTQSLNGGGFTLDATVGETVAETAVTGGTFSINSGFWVPVLYNIGLEGDVAARPNGDGEVLSNDVVLVRRFFNGTTALDADVNEFQRADAAPRNTLGDGTIASNDIVQTRRYQNLTDLPQTAGGQQSPSGFAPFVGEGNKNKAKNLLIAPRVLRVESTTANAGQTFTVNIRVDTMGDEAEYGFRLNYQQAKLSNPVIGAGNAGAGVRACNVAVAGVVNCSVGAFPNNLPGSSDPGIGEIGVGINQILITVTFNVASNPMLGPSPLTLSNINVSNDNADLLAISGVDGFVTIFAPTAAGVSISGRVLTPNGRGLTNARVTLTEATGQTRTTRTTSFGYYRFSDIEAGQTVVISVQSKRYRFSSQTLNVNEDLTDLNFTPET